MWATYSVCHPEETLPHAGLSTSWDSHRVVEIVRVKIFPGGFASGNQFLSMETDGCPTTRAPNGLHAWVCRLIAPIEEVFVLVKGTSDRVQYRVKF